MAGNFGIYIKTFRPDYHLAKALIASIRHFHPELDIMLVPDDGYAQSTLWGEKVLNVDDPFLLGLKGYYKKLWVFYGPFERFIYTDADALLLRPLSPIMVRMRECRERFFLACTETKTVRALANDPTKAAAICSNMLGNLRLIEDFDPAYDFQRVLPFPSGFFASHRGAIPLDVLKDSLEALDRYHRAHGLPDLSEAKGQRWGVFNADQGLINYLFYRSGIAAEGLEDVFAWGGRPVEPIEPAQRYRNTFVHWAGCPRPSILRQGVPCGREWFRFYREFHQTRSFGECAVEVVRNIWDELRLRVRNAGHAVKLWLRRRSRSRSRT